MKIIILILLCLLFVSYNLDLLAQNQFSQKTQLEIGIGYVTPFLYSGSELISSNSLRKQSLSYYKDEIGNRINVGKYSSISGFNFSITYYKPIVSINGLMTGVIVRNAQTGSTPDNGGYEEAYFFNFITAGPAIKYYPFENNNLFLKADASLAAVLTKNRFINSLKEQNYFHQFGIGYSIALETGYSLTPFDNKSIAIETKAGYQYANTRVEVNGIGDDNWQFGAILIGISIIF